MARNRVGTKGNNRRRVKKRDEDSDESDEEYKVTDDEDFEQSDECCSLDSDGSEEMSAQFRKSWRVSRSRNTRRTSSSKKVNENIKLRKRRGVSYTEEEDDDDDDDGVADDDDEDFMSSDRDAKQVNKRREKKRVSSTKVDDDDDEEEEDEEEYKEFVFSGKNRKQRKKPQDKKRVVSTDDDEDENEDEDEVEVANEDDAEFMSSDGEANHLNKPMGKKRDSYTDVYSYDGGGGNDDDDDGEFVFSEEDNDDEVEVGDDGAVIKQRKKSREKRILDTEEDEKEVEAAYDDDDDDDDVKLKPRKKPQEEMVLDTEEDDEEVEVADEDEDDAEFMSFGMEANQMRPSKEMKRVSYTDMDDDDNDDDDSAEFVSSARKRNRRKKPQEKRVVYTEDDEDDDDDEECLYSGKKVNQKKNLRKKRGVSYAEDDDDLDLGFMSTSRKRKQINKRHDQRIVPYKEDIPEEEDENDAEFKLSESDFVDDEDETPEIKKNKVTRPHPQKRSVRGGQKKSKRSKIKNPTKPKQRGQKTRTDKTQVENRSRISRRRNQKSMAESDSDFVSSASSDHEYTISEEEREQMIEAREYCASLRAKLRSSSCGNHEKQPAAAAYEQKKYPIRKGKEKIDDMKDDLGKQVCGICLSEEQKRTTRGVLNCCRHYFCFSCIMEWSKVESRCPLCKQRFTTITKAAKSDTRFDVRTMVIPVPECDQVYEPSEEELRGYLDPYESVICTECQNGGEDALMLLCDICDSSAHTFCVGLGREVPEGNWYCEGCRPTVFGTLNSQRLTTLPDADRRLGNNASDLPSSSPIAGGFDLNEAYVPETPLTQQQTRIHAEPNSAAPTGTVATTLRDRRRIHRQIHHRFLNNNRMNDLVGRSNASSSSGIRLFGSHLDQARVPVSQNDYILPSVHDSSNFYTRTDQFSVASAADVALQDEHETLQEFRIGICTNRPPVR